MTDASSPAVAVATARTPRPRAPRRAPTDLTFRLDEATVDRLAAGEPDWQAADRRAAFARFRELPIETNSLYTGYVDLRTTDLEAVTPYDATAGAPAGGRPSDLPEGASAIAVIRQDAVDAIVLDEAARAAGVTISTLRTFVTADPAAARRLLTDPASIPADDKLAQLTRAAWNQGVVVRVPAGVKLDRPIVVRWVAAEPGSALLTRTIVELGEGASASLLEEMHPGDGAVVPDAGQALFTGTLEVHLAKDAELAVASIQDLGLEQVVFQHRNASIGEGARLHWALAQLGSRLVRSRVDNRLEGDRSEVEQVEIVFGGSDQLFDLTSYTRHVGRDTTGILLSKGALLDQAKSFMKGMIEIDRSAVGTDSFLGEFGMNLSKSARAVAVPSLEIDQPDCRRAAHSSSVGPIDETQIFYLESRGIPTDEARKFIVLGFLEPVVARVPLPDAQDRLRELLEEKWAAGTVAPDADAAA